MATAQAPELAELKDEAFPLSASAAEKLAFLVPYATLAPSGHNRQPWRFATRGDALELWADRSRSLRVLDPHDRELVISCGSALLNLRLALRRFGYQGSVELKPEAGEPDLLALVGLGERLQPGQDDFMLFNAIPRRRTNRNQFEDRRVPDELAEQLKSAAAEEGAWLSYYREPEGKYALADLISRGDRTQFSDPAFRDELGAWLRPNHAGVSDGMPGYGFASGDQTVLVSPFVLRTFDMGGSRPARDHDLAASSSMLAVIGTEADDARGWLAAGQALERVLLLARTEGVWASFLNQPVEVDPLRSELRDLVGLGGFPQMLIRLGYGPEPLRMPRRPLRDVLS
jgi:nitroreductase